MASSLFVRTPARSHQARSSSSFLCSARKLQHHQRAFYSQGITFTHSTPQNLEQKGNWRDFRATSATIVSSNLSQNITARRWVILFPHGVLRSIQPLVPRRKTDQWPPREQIPIPREHPDAYRRHQPTRPPKIRSEVRRKPVPRMQEVENEFNKLYSIAEQDLKYKVSKKQPLVAVFEGLEKNTERRHYNAQDLQLWFELFLKKGGAPQALACYNLLTKYFSLHTSDYVNLVRICNKFAPSTTTTTTNNNNSNNSNSGVESIRHIVVDCFERARNMEQHGEDVQEKDILAALSSSSSSSSTSSTSPPPPSSSSLASTSSPLDSILPVPLFVYRTLFRFLSTTEDPTTAITQALNNLGPNEKKLVYPVVLEVAPPMPITAVIDMISDAMSLGSELLGTNFFDVAANALLTAIVPSQEAAAAAAVHQGSKKEQQQLVRHLWKWRKHFGLEIPASTYYRMFELAHRIGNDSLQKQLMREMKEKHMWIPPTAATANSSSTATLQAEQK